MREWLHAVVPTGLTVILLLVLHGGTPSLSPNTVLPNIAAIMVLFWSWYRPALLPSGIIFLLGLLQDVLSGTPLGLHAVTLLLLRWLALGRLAHLAEKPFLLQWAAAWVALGAELLLRALIGHLWSPAPLLAGQLGMEWLATAMAYPLFHVLCGWIYEALPHPRAHAGRG